MMFQMFDSQGKYLVNALKCILLRGLVCTKLQPSMQWNAFLTDIQPILSDGDMT
jgi:hypothetical protein